MQSNNISPPCHHAQGSGSPPKKTAFTHLDWPRSALTDLIPTPDIPAKVEIRMMYLWKDGDPRTRPAINLARLSKGKMIGVRYNKDKEWVGGSVCFLEQ